MVEDPGFTAAELKEAMNWRQDIQYNGIQHNGIQHNGIQHNAIQHNAIQHNAIQHNDTQYNNTQQNDAQYNNFVIKSDSFHCLLSVIRLSVALLSVAAPMKCPVKIKSFDKQRK